MKQLKPNNLILNKNPAQRLAASPGFYLQDKKAVILNRDKKIFNVVREGDVPAFVWIRETKRIYKIDPKIIVK